MKFVLTIYNGDNKQIGQEVAYLPALQPDAARNGFNFTHSQLHRDGEDTVMVVARVIVERRVID